MWCLTCGFSPDDPESADEEHMAYDGCHRPAWVDDDDYEVYDEELPSQEYWDGGDLP